METNPGKSCTCPRLPAKRSTISSAAPSLTGRLLKIAITETSELLAGDHDAAAANSFGHLERPEDLSHQFPRARPMRRVLGDTHVYLEVCAVLYQALEHPLRQPVATFTTLAGQDHADLVVPETGEHGPLR